MKIACLDLEGVLIPEVWINFAERTGIAELRMTTRDEPDYDVLMKRRLEILAENRLGLPDIQEVIGGMNPLEGAGEGCFGACAEPRSGGFRSESTTSSGRNHRPGGPAP